MRNSVRNYWFTRIRYNVINYSFFIPKNPVQESFNIKLRYNAINDISSHKILSIPILFKEMDYSQIVYRQYFNLRWPALVKPY